MSKPKVSIIINLDTRPENLRESEMGKGVVHRDFLIDGIRNKKAFFKGCDCEVIAFIDIHEYPQSMIHDIAKEVTTLVLRKHQPWGSHYSHETMPNDYNYAHALSLARGEYIAHFDMDVAAFSRDSDIVKELLSLSTFHDYVCYPSEHSPAPCHDDSFNYWWASTRFFLCMASKIPLIEHYLKDHSKLKNSFLSPKKLFWTEHILGRYAYGMSIPFSNGFQPVFYPKFDLNRYSIFTFQTYRSGLLKTLNSGTYDNVLEFINKSGGIFYPCNLEVAE